MNKKVTLTIGFILLAIIAYQGYLLYQKDHPNSSIPILKDIVKSKDEPQININIDKQHSSQSKNSNPNQTIPSNPTPSKQNQISNLSPQTQTQNDQAKIEQKFRELLETIFNSKEVQDGLKEFKSQAQIGIKELQKELQELPKQLDNLSTQFNNDPIFSQIFNSLKGINAQNFQDMKDRYQITLKVNKDDKVDISTNDNFITVTIASHKKKSIKDANHTIMQNSNELRKILLTIPANSLVEKIKTEYNDGLLTIILPKIKEKGKI
jgi:HSP20 family molecular chaperone IbpA